MMANLERKFVFLSYAHEDLDRVRMVYDGLKKRKVNAWFDKVDLGPGRWKDRIEKAISRSRYFIFCLSEASLKKTGDENPGFVDKELQIAWKFASEQDETVFTIIPIRLEDCGRGDMRLSGWQQYDLFEDWEGVLDTLAVNLGGVSLSDAMAIDERTEKEKIFDSIMGRAAMFYYSSQYEKAFSHFEFATNINPDVHQAWYNKGVALADLGRHDEALEAYNKAKEINPESWAVWFQMGKSLACLGRHDEAIKAFDKAIERNPPDSWAAWFHMGKSLACLGLHNEAIEAYDEAIKIKSKIKPDFYAAWFHMGKSLACLGRHEKANEAFDKAIEIKRDFYPAWFHKVESLECLGRNDEAKEAFNKAKKI